MYVYILPPPPLRSKYPLFLYLGCGHLWSSSGEVWQIFNFLLLLDEMGASLIEFVWGASQQIRDFKCSFLSMIGALHTRCLPKHRELQIKEVKEDQTDVWSVNFTWMSSQVQIGDNWVANPLSFYQISLLRQHFIKPHIMDFLDSLGDEPNRRGKNWKPHWETGGDQSEHSCEIVPLPWVKPPR